MQNQLARVSVAWLSQTSAGIQQTSIINLQESSLLCSFFLRNRWALQENTLETMSLQI